MGCVHVYTWTVVMHGIQHLLQTWRFFSAGNWHFKTSSFVNEIAVTYIAYVVFSVDRNDHVPPTWKNIGIIPRKKLLHWGSPLICELPDISGSSRGFRRENLMVFSWFQAVIVCTHLQNGWFSGEEFQNFPEFPEISGNFPKMSGISPRFGGKIPGFLPGFRL